MEAIVLFEVKQAITVFVVARETLGRLLLLKLLVVHLPFGHFTEGDGIELADDGRDLHEQS